MYAQKIIRQARGDATSPSLPPSSAPVNITFSIGELILQTDIPSHIAYFNTHFLSFQDQIWLSKKKKWNLKGFVNIEKERERNKDKHVKLRYYLQFW